MAVVSALLTFTGQIGELSAQEAHLGILAEKFQTDLTEIAQAVPGVMGIAVVDLTSGERFGINEELVFPQGSSIKIPVLIELFKQAEAGQLQLDEQVVVSEADQTGGSGVLEGFGDGTSVLAFRDLAVLMIVLSDNSATNILIEQVGMENVNRTMAELGVPRTKLQRKMIQPQSSAVGDENLSTPAEAAELMGRIVSCQLPMSADACADLRSILEIPKAGSLPDPIPGNVAVAWKPGGITGVSVAWGVVDLPGRPYVLTAMVNYSEGGAAGNAIRQASEVTYDYFSRLAGATPYGTRVPLRYLPSVGH